MEGKKNDQGKPRFDLIDPWFHEDIAKALTGGAEVHGDYNWQSVLGAKDRYIAALERHLIALKKGWDIDSESALQHTAHIACNAMFLHWLIRTNNEVHEEETVNASADIPGHPGIGSPVYDPAGHPSSTGDEPDHEEKINPVERTRTGFTKDIALPNASRAHKSSGACVGYVNPRRD